MLGSTKRRSHHHHYHQTNGLKQSLSPFASPHPSSIHPPIFVVFLRVIWSVYCTKQYVVVNLISATKKVGERKKKPATELLLAFPLLLISQPTYVNNGDFPRERRQSGSGETTTQRHNQIENRDCDREKKQDRAPIGFSVRHRGKLIDCCCTCMAWHTAYMMRCSQRLANADSSGLESDDV